MRTLLRQLGPDLMASKHYVIASCLVFIAGWVIGATDSGFGHLLQSQTEGIRKIASTIAESQHPQLYLFLFIFFNNAVKAVIMVYLGAFLGIWPLSVLIINGMVLGYALTNYSATSPAVLFMKGILPHGILELPAIIIACAYGIRFGGVLIKSFFTMFSKEKERREKSKLELTHFVKMTLPLIAVLTIVLFVAAVIESTVTMRLMS